VDKFLRLLISSFFLNEFEFIFARNFNFKNMNELIKEYLNYYTNLKIPPKFAVLIKGDWGSGKTYFINNYISELEKQKQKKCYYISLYGKNSLNDINNELFYQLFPVINTRLVRLFKG